MSVYITSVHRVWGWIYNIRTQSSWVMATGRWKYLHCKPHAGIFGPGAQLPSDPTTPQGLDFSGHTIKLHYHQSNAPLKEFNIGIGGSTFLCKEMQPSCPRSTMKTAVNLRIIIAAATVSHSHFLRPADSARRLHKSPWLTIQQHDLFQSGLYKFK